MRGQERSKYFNKGHTKRKENNHSGSNRDGSSERVGSGSRSKKISHEKQPRIITLTITVLRHDLEEAFRQLGQFLEFLLEVLPQLANFV